MKLIKPGKLIVLAASSGAGKSTLAYALCDYFKSRYPIERAITYTTRNARVGEVDGKDYYFLTVTDFEKKIKEGFFIEWSAAYGSYYGSPRSIVERAQAGISSLLILDRAGVKQILSLHKDIIVPIWIYTSRDALASRLQARGTETEAQRLFRLHLSQEEQEAEENEPLFYYHVQNDEFTECLNILIKIITKELEII